MLNGYSYAANDAPPNVAEKEPVDRARVQGLPRYASMQALKERGWTATMIDDLLGEPDDYADNPHYKSAAPCKLYDLGRVTKAEATAEYATRLAKLRARRRGKDHTPAFSRKYGVPSAGLVDAAEGLFSLNRYAKHDTCTAKHRNEIYVLKNGFVEWLVGQGHLIGWGEHQVVKPEKILDCYCVRDYGDDGCRRCDFTGVHRTLPELVLRFVVLRFAIGAKTYTWHQPAESVTFQYATKALQIVDAGDWTPERDKPIELPRSQFSKAKALIRWVMEVKP